MRGNNNGSAVKDLLEKVNSATFYLRNMQIYEYQYNAANLCEYYCEYTELQNPKENLAAPIIYEILEQSKIQYDILRFSARVSKTCQLWFKGTHLSWSKTQS